jgi:hypothetical protein
MTPEQALENLDRVAAAIQVNRETTLSLMQSVKVLAAVVAEWRKLIETEPTNDNGKNPIAMGRRAVRA